MSLSAKLLTIFCFLTLIICLSFHSLATIIPITLAVGELEDAQDLLNNDQEGLVGVEHAISFKLPSDAQHIRSSDYVIVSLYNFDAITLPTSLSGDYLGNPSYSLDEKDIKITGIYLSPGGTLRIVGVTATNPNLEAHFNVTITVSEDEEGAIIKNIIHIQAAAFDGSVTVTASIAPPVASLNISGYSAPDTFITLTENGTTIGTDVADAETGLFSKYLTGLASGNHSITIYGVDNNSLTTSPYTFSVSTPLYQVTSVTGLLLSPTIQIDSTTIVQGDNLIAQGSTIPSGDISLFTESPLSTYYTTADSVGAWSYTIDDTSTYNVGDYRVYALVQNSIGTQSLFSNSLQFSVTASSSATPSPPACSIDQGDLNCDDAVNLIDFSILMYYWGTDSSSADINEDDIVNLIDFSIMMYYWGT
ncbi:hypothetical protein GYA49_01525 [Candidatus Beckwithbacteria bacterium]|nr:hypothetical protein [Candidatus Beckwithbacteria bacterium]